MRLICPNCGAQYEVPEGAVPETGRDVECSNCGETWFVQPGGAEAQEPPAVEAPQPSTPPEDEPEPEPAEPPRTDRPRRRELDPHVASVLQAERDLAARRRAEREAQSFESQPDLALEQVPETARPRREPQPQQFDETDEAAEPFAFVPSEPPEAEEDPERPEDAADQDVEVEPSAETTEPERDEATAPVRDTEDHIAHDPGPTEQTPAERAAAAEGFQRRELLPDIDTINSSLQPRQGSSNAKRWQVQSTGAELREQRRRGGFRIGFLTVLLLALLLTLAYGQADRIARTVPAASPLLESYVETVNAGRLWLDLHLQEVLAQLETLAQQ